VLWTIRHLTRYKYKAPVFLEPHVLRLRPATDACQSLRKFKLKITPAPAGRTESVDIEGNDATQVWFEAAAGSLTIDAFAEVESLRENPFDYLWDGPSTLPLRYRDELRGPLALYTGSRTPGKVSALADEAAVAAGRNAQFFPLSLARLIHERCRQVSREFGEPLLPEETLKRGEGSCRDLSLLFIEAARSKGYGARFVSGYGCGNDGVDDLHAWAELYLPGGGWRGFEPSTGLAVADRHIVLARSASPQLAAPVHGAYRGNAQSTLTTKVTIEPT
jgi:transglutaminase-like putative cysteine protease